MNSKVATLINLTPLDEEKKSCIGCEYARQVADLDRQDIVGCLLMTLEEIGRITPTNGKTYQGYFYSLDKAGQRSFPKNNDDESDLILGILIDSHCCCEYWKAG